MLLLHFFVIEQQPWWNNNTYLYLHLIRQFVGYLCYWLAIWTSFFNANLSSSLFRLFTRFWCESILGFCISCIHPILKTLSLSEHFRIVFVCPKWSLFPGNFVGVELSSYNQQHWVLFITFEVIPKSWSISIAFQINEKFLEYCPNRTKYKCGLHMKSSLHNSHWNASTRTKYKTWKHFASEYGVCNESQYLSAEYEISLMSYWLEWGVSGSFIFSFSLCILFHIHFRFARLNTEKTIFFCAPLSFHSDIE